MRLVMFITSGLPVTREESQYSDCQRQMSQNQTSWEFGLPTSAERALYGKLACRAFTRCWPTPEEHIPSGLDRVRVGLFTPAIIFRFGRLLRLFDNCRDLSVVDRTCERGVV